MSANSTVWLVDEYGKRIPGTDKLLTFELTPRWTLDAWGHWRMPRDATVASYEVADFGTGTVLDDDTPRRLKAGQDLNVHLWMPMAPTGDEASARLAYMRDEITLDEFERRVGAA